MVMNYLNKLELKELIFLDQLVVVIVNLFNDDEDNDLLWVEDKLGLLVALVDREFAVEFLVLDLDLDRDCSLILAGDISIMNWEG